MKRYYVVQNYNSSYYEKLSKKRTFGKNKVEKDTVRGGLKLAITSWKTSLLSNNM